MSDWKKGIVKKSDEHQRNVDREDRGRAVHNVPDEPKKPDLPKERTPAKDDKK